MDQIGAACRLGNDAARHLSHGAQQLFAVVQNPALDDREAAAKLLSAAMAYQTAAKNAEAAARQLLALLTGQQPESRDEVPASWADMRPHDLTRALRALRCNRQCLDSVNEAILGLQSTDDPRLVPLHDELQRVAQGLRDKPPPSDVC